MKTISLPLICAILIFSSCSSAYKTAQTPDDVYYSPGSQRQAATGNDEYYNANADDQYLMMKSQNAARWSYFDDYSSDNFYSPYYGAYGMYSLYGMYSPFGFGYSPFGFYSGFGFSPFMNFGFEYYGPGYLSNYYLWNGLYNPYYGGAIVVTKSAPYNYYSQLHPFTLANYTGTAINNSNGFRATNTRPSSLNPQNRFTRFSVNANNSNNNNYNSNSNRFNSNNNNFFRSQSTQSVKSFGSFGGGGGGSSRSFGRMGR